MALRAAYPHHIFFDQTDADVFAVSNDYDLGVALAASASEAMDSSGAAADPTYSVDQANNTIVGASGGDTFDIWSHGPGTDFDTYLSGGSGFNTLDYSQSPGPVNVDMSAGTTSNYYGGTDHFSNIEQVIGSAYNDFLTAGASGATLNGGVGNNTMTGGAGNDTFDVWIGSNNFINGGGGFNTLDYSQASGAVSVGNGMTFHADSSTDHFSNIQQVIGTAFNDVLSFQGEPPLGLVTLNGGPGDNTLIGGVGNNATFDIWNHSPGTDYTNYITGASSGDTQPEMVFEPGFPGLGNNTLDYSESPGPINVNMTTGITSNYHGGTDHFADIQQVIGTAFDDVLDAGSGPGTWGNSSYTLFEGADGGTIEFAGGVTFNGGPGNNTMVGTPEGGNTFDLWSDGPGTNYTNYINGGSDGTPKYSFNPTELLNIGTNTLDYSQAPGPITANLMTGTTLNYYGGTDHFSNIQAVVGSAYNDTLISDQNVILTGGGGSNIFDFPINHANGATVTDFVSGTDQLEFGGFGTAAQGATFTQNNSTQWTINSADGTDHETITLSNAPTIHPSDYFFV
jgi:hypothetical protein